MRLIFSTLIALFVTAVMFFMIKIWGQSQPVTTYDHPFLNQLQNSQSTGQPTQFQLAKPYQDISPNEPHFLNIGITRDNQWVLTPSPEFLVHAKTWEQIKDHAQKLEDVLAKIKNKSLILNLVDNPADYETSFLELLTKHDLAEGKTLIFTSPYEVPLKNMKEKNPTWLLGSSQPEVLKLKTMEGLFLIEATTLRADIVIEPLKINHQQIFTPDVVDELKRRRKQFIVGPVSKEDLPKALELKPLAVIVE